MTMTEEFTADERSRLEPRFTNLDRPCFALRNLPETVRGALFARYSRSAKPLRRLYLDEFDSDLPPTASIEETNEAGGRAAALYDRVLGQYGDDSVAQLGSAHVACEGVSNVLTKVLERGRLMSYLEQSTRYIPYTERPGAAGSTSSPRRSATRPTSATTVKRWTTPSRPTPSSWTSPRRTSARRTRPGSATTPTPGSAPSAPARSTRCAACCPRPRAATSASTAPAKPSRRCCCASAHTRWPKRRRWPEPCSPSYSRSSRRSYSASSAPTAAASGATTSAPGTTRPRPPRPRCPTRRPRRAAAPATRCA